MTRKFCNLFAVALATLSLVVTAKAEDQDESVVLLQYVECTGEQWVDIDFTPTSTSIIEMDVEFTDETGAWHNTLFCSRDSSSANPFSLYALGGNLGWRFDYGTQGSNSGMQYPVGRSVHLRADATGFYMDQERLFKAPAGSSSPVGKMMLFASYSGAFGDSVSNFAKLKCRSVVLRDSSNPRFCRELLPHSVGGVACLLDMTTGTPYYSGSQVPLTGSEWRFLQVTGTPFGAGDPVPDYGVYGEDLLEDSVLTCRAERVALGFWGKSKFSLCGWRLRRWDASFDWVRLGAGSDGECRITTAGVPYWLEWRYTVRSDMSDLPDDYEELAYVRSDGRQYFDTQYVPNGRTRVVARYRRTVQGEWPHYVFGCQSGECRFKFSHSNADDKGAIFGYDKNVSTAVNPKIDDDMLEHVVDVSNGVFRVDGETVWTAETPWSSSGNTWSIYLFASHEKYTVGPMTEATVGYHSFTAIGGFTVYEDNVVVHDFVPCQRKADGAVGFYDLCAEHDQFRAASGSAPLVAGPALLKKYKTDSGFCIFIR